MGCCCSTDSSADSQYGEPNENTRLLGNPAASGSGAGAGGALDSDELHEGEAGSLRDQRSRPAANDEEAQLEAILQEMAASVIDVAAADTQNLEPQDYIDRSKHYTAQVHRLAAGGRQAALLSLRPNMEDVPQPERVLAAPAARQQELRAARQLAERVAEAVRAIQVTSREPLVTPFGGSAAGEPA